MLKFHSTLIWLEVSEILYPVGEALFNLVVSKDL